MMPVPASDLPSNLVPSADLPNNLVPASDLPDMKKPEVGGLESFGRGAANAFALGYSPQLIAGIKTGHMPGSENKEYLAELAKQKASNEEAWNQHPWLYGTGMAAAAVPAAANAIFAGPEEAVAAGGAGLLAESGNIASLASAGLRGIAGGSRLAGTAADVLANPLTQGAIYGSSEGENLSDKLSGAAAGAIGAKVAPMVLGAAGKAVGSLGSKIAPKFSEQVSQALSNGVSKGDIAGAIGNDVGFSVPGFVKYEKGPSNFVAGTDIRNSMGKASAKTRGEIGGILSDMTQGANANDTGEAVRNAIAKWSYDKEDPNGFKTQLDSYFKPLQDLRDSSTAFNLSNTNATLDSIRNSSKAKISDVEPTLKIMSYAENSPNGLTFDEMHELRQLIGDEIDFNRGPNSKNLDEAMLKKLYGSVTKDMQNATEAFGGKDKLAAFNEANKNASDLYNIRQSVLRITGNPDVNGAGRKNAGQIYQGIENAALKKAGGPDVSDLSNLQDVLNSYDPDTWDKVGQTYVANKIAPNGNFSFQNLGKTYDTDLHPRGKDLLFGSPVSNDLRSNLDKIEAFGSLPAGEKTIGGHIDELAGSAGNKAFERKGILSELGLGVGEAALFGGLPLKTLAGMGTASGLGAYGARNVARPLSQYAPTTGQKVIGKALQKSAPLIGAQAVNPWGVGAVNAAVPYGIMKATEQFPPWLYDTGQHASGGRIERKAGGRIQKDPKAEAERLIKMADKLKKDEGSKTESLLNLDDTTVAKALEIANRGI